MNKSEEIEITGVEPHNEKKRIIGYAICRQWRDNPKDVEVYEYATTEKEAKNVIKNLPKSVDFKWFIGVYQ